MIHSVLSNYVLRKALVSSPVKWEELIACQVYFLTERLRNWLRSVPFFLMVLEAGISFCLLFRRASPFIRNDVLGLMEVQCP